MNLKNKLPIFVPDQYRAEIEKMSKAALMDMAWNYAQQLAAAGHEVLPQDEYTMEEFRKRRDIILEHRKH